MVGKDARKVADLTELRRTWTAVLNGARITEPSRRTTEGTIWRDMYMGRATEKPPSKG